MQRPLRDYSTPELERLLADIRTAIERAETAEARSTAGDAAPAAAAQDDGSEAETPAPQAADAVKEERREAPLPPEPAASEPGASEPPAPEPPASEPAGEPAAAAPLPIRYMHPSNRNLTWTGEGERPEWVDVYLSLGGSWTALENTAEKLRRRPG